MADAPTERTPAGHTPTGHTPTGHTRTGHTPAGADPAASRPPRLVLASASPRRRELLGRLGLDPEVRPVDLDETPAAGEDGGTLASRLARAKAAAGAARGRGDEVVLAADTVVVLDGRSLGKPRDRHEAAAMLRALSGRTHEVVTGVAVVRAHDEAVASTDATTVTTTVTFRRLGDDEVAWYVATGEPDDKAGGYGIQGAGAVLVDRIDGNDTNVVGLPLPTTVQLLRAAGFDPLATGHGRPAW